MNEKVVFISHSSKDAEFAQKVCSVMECNNLPCWIAPRDIPYGNYWCEEITVAISKAKVMLYIHSKNSNSKSEQVLREIHQAVKNGVTIIPIRITTDNYNASLEYFISLNHWLQIDEDRATLQLTELSRRITLFINDVDYTTDTVFNKYFENLDLAIDETVNIDEELHSQLSEMHSSECFSEVDDRSNTFKQKLIQRAGEATLLNMFKEENIREFSYKDKNDISVDDNSSDNNTDENGTYFYCYEQKNNDTLAFLLSYMIDQENYNRILTAILLDKMTEERDDGDKDVCFFIDSSDYEGNPIVFSTIDNDKCIVTWCLGFLDGDTLKIAREPAAIQEISISNNRNKSVVRYSANEHGAIILDVEAHKVVERKRYYDKSSGQWKYYVELLNNNKYIIFNPKFKNNNSPADPFNIGYGYYKGKYGLRKNAIEAATWFEKSGTKEAYYYLSEIFKNDPVLKNEEDYTYYIGLYNSK